MTNSNDVQHDVYLENGYSNRDEYLSSLCDYYPSDMVWALSDFLGENEDFDGLISALEDYDGVLNDLNDYCEIDEFEWENEYVC